MKIHFNGISWSSNSGPNSFAYRLAHQLSLNGHIIADPNDYDIDLVFIEKSILNTIPSAKVIQRLDGIWSAPNQINVKNDNILSLYKTANGIIFQSEFDKEFISSQWGLPENFTIINNGIEIKIYELKKEGLINLRNQYDKIFVCSSNWHRQKRLKENTELFLYIKKFYSNSCLLVLGANPDYTVAHKDIFYSGSLSHELCLEIFSMADWMIHLEYASHMPNVIIEALSQDCPIIYSEMGGAREVIKENGIAIKEYNNKIFLYAPFDYDNPPELNINQIKLPFPEIKNFDKSNIDIKFIASQYEKFFTKLI